MEKCCMVREDGIRCDAEIRDGDQICDSCCEALERAIEDEWERRLDEALRLAMRN